MLRLCEIVKDQTTHIGHFMKTAYDLGISVQEETITENILIWLKYLIDKKLVRNTYIKYYDKGAEFRQGVDFEWWLKSASTGKWISLRVQAKKMHPDEKYRLKHIYKGSKEWQVDRLINKSKKGLKKIPLYCFYNQHDTSFNSWTYTSAYKVKSLLSLPYGKVMTRSTFSYSEVGAKPMTDLFCSSRKGAITQNLLQQIQQMHKDFLSNDFQLREEDYIHSSAPSYVTSLFDFPTDSIRGDDATQSEDRPVFVIATIIDDDDIHVSE
ncbi:hypothetical protein OB236_14410 [Paenibacillus sp. WQ 127069]|uniref:DUF4365 domain-containing protein n=1 Tax=Paenibacillus baimaensis TaxID=2982185 RepID=A0ABT2UF93_9BACL|nr:DUF6615 family protein [Paenibacillus sp. WQ 127069]MCU6793306.1 hypothetical protein [Paenibacillus sp. WQ 127069]